MKYKNKREKSWVIYMDTDLISSGVTGPSIPAASRVSKSVRDYIIDDLIRQLRKEK